jgi:DNA-binding MarR family transcriptional regulator
MGRLRIIYNSELPHRAVAVYMYLYDRADKQMQCFPAIKTIAKDLRFSPSTIKRAIGDLVKAGYLEKEQQYKRNKTKTTLLYTVKTP